MGRKGLDFSLLDSVLKFYTGKMRDAWLLAVKSFNSISGSKE